MKARLFSDGQIIGTCVLAGPNARNVSVIQYRQEFYVFDASINGYALAHHERVYRIEWTPRELTDPEPRLPLKD